MVLASVISAVTALTPLVYPAKSYSECHQTGSLQHNEQLMEVITQTKQQLSSPGCNPPKNRSCQEILYCFPSTSSGNYQIHAPNGSSVQVYCNMEGNICGNITGWLRVAYLNMTQPGASCPQGLVQQVKQGLTLCYRNGVHCPSISYATLNLSYSQVCGQVLGYQRGTPDAFGNYLNNNHGIDSFYVDGVSITYGNSPRKHIWTYAGGLRQSRIGPGQCLCNNGSLKQPPPFVGKDYYCESGTSSAPRSDVLYSSDILWDGKQCDDLEAPCCIHPNMPWFLKTLNETTTEDIELRVCANYLASSFEDTPLQFVELLVR